MVNILAPNDMNQSGEFNRGVRKGVEGDFSGSLTIRVARTFFTLPEDKVMARKIKPPIKKGAVTRPSSSQNGT